MASSPVTTSEISQLSPCPYCGGGTTEIHPNGRVWMGTKYSEPASVEVRHWCPPEPGQPSRMLVRVGRDEAAAVAAWEKRAPLTAGQERGVLERCLAAVNACAHGRTYGVDLRIIHNNAVGACHDAIRVLMGDTHPALESSQQAMPTESGARPRRHAQSD